MDLMAFINNPIKVSPNTSVLIPTGLSIAIPEDVEIQIRPRSGLAAKSNIGASKVMVKVEAHGEQVGLFLRTGYMGLGHLVARLIFLNTLATNKI